MNDAILGKLTKDERIPGSFKGTIPFQQGEIELRVDPDGNDLSHCLDLARLAVAALGELDKKARLAAAQELLVEYNQNWREYQRGDGAGGFVKVSNPELTEENLTTRIRLTCLSVTGGEVCCLGYADDCLFAGHTIFVSSFDGIAFSDVSVELFG